MPPSPHSNYTHILMCKPIALPLRENKNEEFGNLLAWKHWYILGGQIRDLKEKTSALLYTKHIIVEKLIAYFSENKYISRPALGSSCFLRPGIIVHKYWLLWAAWLKLWAWDDLKTILCPKAKLRGRVWFLRAPRTYNSTMTQIKSSQ